MTFLFIFYFLDSTRFGDIVYCFLFFCFVLCCVVRFQEFKKEKWKKYCVLFLSSLFLFLSLSLSLSFFHSFVIFGFCMLRYMIFAFCLVFKGIFFFIIVSNVQIFGKLKKKLACHFFRYSIIFFSFLNLLFLFIVLDNFFLIYCYVKGCYKSALRTQNEGQ